MITLDSVLFIAFPYVSIGMLLVGSIYRYRKHGYSISSLSVQFLENKVGFWGTMPFHIGIIILALGHLAIFLFPEAILFWNSDPTRLIIHEGIAFTFGVVVLVAMTVLLIRRWTNPRLRMVTTIMDNVIESLIYAQIVLGCWIALGYRWGSSWFAADLTPYLRSIVTFDPEISAMSAMPWVIKLHVIGAFLIVLLIPFSRLAHFLVAPIHYIWRPYQIVMWHWDRKKIRSADTEWQSTRPRNN
ncbi:MAG: respiratory nitrate reductase subunit gamma [Gammaproteobacteria bacterium]|jgi:nitrate reductase gamma subunit|nr:nitrate reductase [Gammaproteobacteria bacterium]MDP6146289.1 respiratory nitrate reductase subunit gamma [Gammaproteobacteria bacterium]HJL80256.1 respiratory nitrate reductase subunit gamma [Gammaproteobacteria bacterium]HJN01132.1 respiratory nitrate reductase subunit gamma [Gammaproteobacteria bacterium]|tara:strand:+ start:1933 stop:2661 length:729 start_codon:yes stop_codon:yes gene_type:complete